MKRAIVAAALLAMSCMGPAPQQQAKAQGLCKTWSEPEKVGAIDLAVLNEASGIAASKAYPGRLYHHNDAAHGPKFYVTDGAGKIIRTVVLAGYSATDLEDIAIGPCVGAASCVYLGDIGDNTLVRGELAFVEMAEKAEFADEEKPLRIIRVRYPDAPRNAEGFALDGKGDLYVVTKRGGADTVTRLYRVTAKQLAVSDGSVQTMEALPPIDLGKFEPPVNGVPAPPNARRATVTAMDISPDGSKALLLAYGAAWEFDLRALVAGMPEGASGAAPAVQAISIAQLPQAEAVTYTPDGNSFLYTSEYMRGGTESAIYRQTCTVR